MGARQNFEGFRYHRWIAEFPSMIVRIIYYQSCAWSLNHVYHRINRIATQRNVLARQIASVGEFRPGNLYENARKCGNSKCQFARPDGTLHRGWLLTRKVSRKTRSCSIPEFALDDTRCQVDEHRRFLRSGQTLQRSQ